MKKIFGVFLITLALAPSVFAKKVVFEYGKFPAEWRVSYQVDKNMSQESMPPSGLWMTQSGFIAREIVFDKKIVFSTKNPKTKIEIVKDGMNVRLTDKNGKPSWEKSKVKKVK
jgi:hypothetical protein